MRNVLVSVIILLILAIIWSPEEDKELMASVEVEVAVDRQVADLLQVANEAKVSRLASDQRAEQPTVEIDAPEWQQNARQRGDLDLDTAKGVIRLAWHVIETYQSPDDTRLTAYSFNGERIWIPEAPAIDVSQIKLRDVYYVTAVPREVSSYDYRIAVWEHKDSDQVAAVVVMWAAGGLVAAQGRIAYPQGAGPPILTSQMSMDMAATAIGVDNIRHADRIFTWGVSPEQWMYRFQTDKGTWYVSQDPPKVWDRLEDWWAYAEERDAEPIHE